MSDGHVDRSRLAAIPSTILTIPEGNEENHGNLNDDSETPNLDLNQGPSEYEGMPLTGRRGLLQKSLTSER
jgi:hypothetical protein